MLNSKIYLQVQLSKPSQEKRNLGELCVKVKNVNIYWYITIGISINILTMEEEKELFLLYCCVIKYTKFNSIKHLFCLRFCALGIWKGLGLGLQLSAEVSRAGGYTSRIVSSFTHVQNLGWDGGNSQLLVIYGPCSSLSMQPP